MIGAVIRRAPLAMMAIAALALPAYAADPTFESAQQLYEDCLWQQAFESSSRLADAGDPQAPRIAAQMARCGNIPYGRGFQATAVQIERWRLAAANMRQASR